MPEDLLFALPELPGLQIFSLYLPELLKDGYDNDCHSALLPGSVHEEHYLTGNLIRELEEKTRIAENQLKEAQNAHSRTKDEYERLEKILEELNERMEALREESRDRAIRKQQLSGEINVLHEHIYIQLFQIFSFCQIYFCSLRLTFQRFQLLGQLT